MKKNVISFILGALMFGTIGVYAAGGNLIEVFYSVDNIVIDGVSKMPEEKPFVYKGSTYVPLRFISENLGKSVKWDGKTKTINIGSIKNGKEIVHLTDTAPYMYDKVLGYRIDNSNEKNKTMNGSSYYYESNFTMKSGGKDYSKGISVITNSSEDSILYYNLDGKHKKLTGLVAYDENYIQNRIGNDYKVRFYVDDEFKQEVTIRKGDLPQKINMNVENGLQLKIQFVSPKDWSASNPNINLLDMIIE